MKEKDNAEQSM